MVRVQVIDEVKLEKPEFEESTLCLQWCRYIWEGRRMERGYRFIWRRPDDTLQAARGQAIIYSLEDVEQLIEMARNKGWGDYKGGLISEH